MLLLSLSSCFGPTIISIGTYNVTVGDVISKISKVIPKNDDNKEDYENKKL